MRFLVDAQLLQKLARFLNEKGFESIHTLDLPNGNKTTDAEIIELSLKFNYIVMTKDVDFWDIFRQKAEPYKLLYLTVGNIATQDLISLFDYNFVIIIEKIKEFHVVEINRINIISII